MSVQAEDRTGDPVVVLCDPTPAAINAAWRAALVARDLGVPLHLLHAAPAAQRAHASHQVLSGLAARIRGRFDIEVESVAICGDPLHEALRAASAAQMLVVGSVQGNPIRDWILGTSAERLIRLCSVPVLIVKRGTPAPYQRVLVPLDLRPDGMQAVNTAASVAPGAGLEVLHVLAERAAEPAPELSKGVSPVKRGANYDSALQRLTQAVTDAGPACNGAIANVVVGSTPEMILARVNASSVDLVVMSKRPGGVLAEFLLGSVTRRVLADARTDVLVLTGRSRNGATKR